MSSNSNTVKWRKLLHLFASVVYSLTFILLLFLTFFFYSASLHYIIFLQEVIQPYTELFSMIWQMVLEGRRLNYKYKLSTIYTFITLNVCLLRKILYYKSKYLHAIKYFINFCMSIRESLIYRFHVFISIYIYIWIYQWKLGSSIVSKNLKCFYYLAINYKYCWNDYSWAYIIIIEKRTICSESVSNKIWWKTAWSGWLYM